MKKYIQQKSKKTMQYSRDIIYTSKSLQYNVFYFQIRYIVHCSTILNPFVENFIRNAFHFAFFLRSFLLVFLRLHQLSQNFSKENQTYLFFFFITILLAAFVLFRESCVLNKLYRSPNCRSSILQEPLEHGITRTKLLP